MYIPKRLKLVKLKDKGKALLANKDFKKDEVIMKLEGEIKTYDEMPFEGSEYALQIDDDIFLDSEHWMMGDFINHGCNPNIKIDFENMNFAALKDIKKGEEITFNYLTTEYDMIRDKLDFDCKCNSRNCLKRIKGFKFLTKAQKLKLKPMLPPFLKKKL